MEYELIVGVLALILIFYIIFGFGGGEEDCGCGCCGAKKRIHKLMFWNSSDDSKQKFAVETKTAAAARKPAKVGVPNSPKVGVPNSPKVGVPNSPKVGVPNSPKVGVPNSPKVGVPNSPKVRVPRTPVIRNAPANAYVPSAPPKISSIKFGGVYRNIASANTNSYLTNLQQSIGITQPVKNKKNPKKSKFEAAEWLAQRGIGNIASTFEGGDEPVSNAHTDMQHTEMTRDMSNPDLMPINRYYLQY